MRIAPSLFLGLAAVLSAAAPATYGQPLKGLPEVPVSTLIENPQAYKDKAVRVRGTITRVCPTRGCFMKIKGDKPFQDIMVKVEEGTVIFPANGTGKEAVVEGILRVKSLSAKEVKGLCNTQKAALKIKGEGPADIVRIDGLGAEIAR